MPPGRERLVSLEALGLAPDVAERLPDGLRRQVLRFLLRWQPAGSTAGGMVGVLPQTDAGPRDTYDRCRVLVAAGELGRARNLARELVNRPDAGPWGNRAVGEVFLALERPDRADERFRAGDDPVGRARAWLLLGRPDRAVEFLRGADDQDPLVLRVRAEALRRLGDQCPVAHADLGSLYEEELFELQQALDTAPEELAEERSGALPQNPKELQAEVDRVFGYDTLRPGQEDIILPLLRGESVLGLMPTGAGKSLCFQLPAALLPGATLVLSPLIALMKDQVEGLPPRLYRRALVLHGQLEPGEAARRQAAIARGDGSLIYAAPERLRSPAFVRALQRRSVSLLVVDEAHCVSLWGHDFRPDYLFIRQAHQDLGRPVVLALTATATPEMQQDIGRQLDVRFRVVNLGTFRPNLHFSVSRAQSDVERQDRLVRLLQEERGAAIVYVDRRKRAEELAERLHTDGVLAAAYHAGLDRARRELAQDRFMRGDLRVIVATIAFGMGVDKSDVRLVAHYTLPRSLEAYYQEAGRAGRDGLPARCVLLYTAYDLEVCARRGEQDRLRSAEVLRLHDLLREYLATDGGPLPLDKLERASGMDSVRLRVGISLLEQLGLVRRSYDVPGTIWLAQQRHRNIGEAPPETPAGSARHALANLGCADGNARTLPAGRVAAVLGLPLPELEMVLHQWEEAGWIRFRSSGRGPGLVLTSDRHRLEQLLPEALASLAERDEHRVRALLGYVEAMACRQAIISSYFGRTLSKPCGVCDRCEQSPRVAESGPRVYAAPGRKASEPSDSTPGLEAGVALSALEASVLERLRTWRRAQARQEGVPEYAILSDRALLGIARRQPRTLPALAELTGISRSRLRRYGDVILQTVRIG